MFDQTAEAEWLAGYTRPRCETRVRDYWQGLGLDAFLPTYVTSRCWSDRRKLVEAPLFPSYVFLRRGDVQRATRAPGFLWFVRNASGPVSVAGAELHAIRRLLASGLAFDPLPGVALGSEVEVVRGAMIGCRGRLIRKEMAAIVLTISAIQGSVRVNLPDASWVRPLAGPPLMD